MLFKYKHFKIIPSDSPDQKVRDIQMRKRDEIEVRKLQHTSQRTRIVYTIYMTLSTTHFKISYCAAHSHIFNFWSKRKHHQTQFFFFSFSSHCLFTFVNKTQFKCELRTKFTKLRRVKRKKKQITHDEMQTSRVMFDKNLNGKCVDVKCLLTLTA